MFDQLALAIKNIDRKEGLFKWMLLYLIVISITHGEIHPYIKALLIPLSLFGIIFTVFTRGPMFWGLLFSLLVVNLFNSYTYSSNHFFLTVYTVMAICIERYRATRGEGSDLNLKLNPYRSLIIITFGLATLQKIMSSYFLSGRLMATYILGGGGSFFYPLLSSFFPGYAALVDSHYETLTLAREAVVANEMTSQGLSITTPSEHFIPICIFLSVLIIVAELAIFLAASSRKVFYSANFSWIFLSFVWLTFAFRQEYSFFALLLIIFLMSNSEISKMLNILTKSSILILLLLDLTGKLV